MEYSYIHHDGACTVAIIACMPFALAMTYKLVGRQFSLLLILSKISLLLLLIFSTFLPSSNLQKEKPSPLLNNMGEKMCHVKRQLCTASTYKHITFSDNFSPFLLHFLHFSWYVFCSPNLLGAFSLSPNLLQLFLPSYYVRRLFSHRGSGAGTNVPLQACII